MEEKLATSGDWAKLLDRLAATYPLRQRTQDWLCLAWPAGNIEQTVQVKCLRIDGLMRVLCTADVCKPALVNCDDALQLGAKLLVGGVSVRDGLLSIRHNLAEGTFTDREPDYTIMLLRDEAIWLRDQLFQRMTQRQTRHFSE